MGRKDKDRIWEKGRERRDDLIKIETEGVVVVSFSCRLIDG